MGWLWRLICWAFGETGRKAAFYCRFLFVPSLFSSLSLLSFPLFLFSLSPSVSAHGLQCRASGSLSPSVSAALLGWLPLAVASLLPSCWLRLFWRSASGVDLWAALPLGLCLRVSSSASVSGAGASSAPVLSGRVQAFPCPVLRLFWGWRWETMQAKRI